MVLRRHPSRLVVATAQRRLSSPSLRAYLTPAFDAVAAGEGCILGSSSSSLSSGGLDLGFDASLLRFRRACISASTDLEGRLLLYSSQSPLARAVYPAADDEGGAAGGGREMGSGVKRHFFPLTSLQIGENSQSDDGNYGHVQCKPPCSGPYKRRKITRSDAGSSMSEESYSEVLKLSDEWKIGVPALAVHGRVEISRRA